MDFYKRPGIAETLDWVHSLILLHRDQLDPQTIEETLGCLFKVQEDLEKVETEKLAAAWVGRMRLTKGKPEMFKAKSLVEIRRFMEKKIGIPGRDGWDLPTSSKTFPDGAHFRLEIAGVERASTMEALIEEAGKRKVVIHRAIATVGGSTFCDFAELKAMARMAREAKIEVIMTVGHRKGWDAGSKELSTAEGVHAGLPASGIG